MSAVVTDIVIEQDTTFTMTIDVLDSANNPLDVTGYSACCQIRRSYDSANAVNVATTLSNGVLVISLDANATTSMNSGRYVYAARIFSNTISVRLVEGLVTVSPAVAV